MRLILALLLSAQITAADFNSQVQMDKNTYQIEQVAVPLGTFLKIVGEAEQCNAAYQRVPWIQKPFVSWPHSSDYAGRVFKHHFENPCLTEERKQLRKAFP